MCHLQTGSFETAFDVEPFVSFATVQNGLVAAHLLRDIVQSLDDAQSKLLSLLVLRNRDVFNVANHSHIVNELALNYDGSGSNNCIARVTDNKDIVGVVPGRHEVVSVIKLLFGGFAHQSENAKGAEKAYTGQSL